MPSMPGTGSSATVKVLSPSSSETICAQRPKSSLGSIGRACTSSLTLPTLSSPARSKTCWLFTKTGFRSLMSAGSKPADVTVAEIFLRSHDATLSPNTPPMPSSTSSATPETLS